MEGVGPIGAVLLFAMLGSGEAFRNGRRFSACLGSRLNALACVGWCWPTDGKNINKFKFIGGGRTAEQVVGEVGEMLYRGHPDVEEKDQACDRRRAELINRSSGKSVDELTPAMVVPTPFWLIISPRD